MFTTPVSFHIFNRPEQTWRVFNELKKIQPARLFITADGPRAERPDDIEKCARTRAIIDHIDWECDLTTFFSETNQGSFKSTSSGITRVFEQVENAIILEDDCVPHATFFRFCQEMLDHYRDEDRVALIAGNNFLPDSHTQDYSYYFSRYTHMWGWATWKRTWDMIDFSMSNWPAFRDRDGLGQYFERSHEKIYWHDIMQGMYEKRTGLHWDYLLILAMFINNSLVAKSSANLISNTGYDDDATHTSIKTRHHDTNLQGARFPLHHPPEITRDKLADDYMEANYFSMGLGEHLQKKAAALLPDTVSSRLRSVKRRIFGHKQ